MLPTLAAGFRFGLELEFLLVDAETFAPRWYQDLDFETLNQAMEEVDLEGLPSLEGLDLERPHRKAMPFVVEGYYLPPTPDREETLWPKGVEIRTPVCSSIESCLGIAQRLYDGLAENLARRGYRMVAISHHPTGHHFEGPQNKRRYDFWQWAKQAMRTYGPDVNVGPPEGFSARLDLRRLHGRVNYYGPAVAALSLASPFYQSAPWELRGQRGKSIRTYRRSTIAPALEAHPEEGMRLEFKLFEMSPRVEDYRAFFLVWLAMLLDHGLEGLATETTRVYDLGQVARFGLDAETARERATELLERAPTVLADAGFDPAGLAPLVARLESGRLPADDLLEAYDAADGELRPVLETLAKFE